MCGWVRSHKKKEQNMDSPPPPQHQLPPPPPSSPTLTLEELRQMNTRLFESLTPPTFGTHTTIESRNEELLSMSEDLATWTSASVQVTQGMFDHVIYDMQGCKQTINDGKTHEVLDRAIDSLSKMTKIQCDNLLRLNSEFQDEVQSILLGNDEGGGGGGGGGGGEGGGGGGEIVCKACFCPKKECLV